MDQEARFLISELMTSNLDKGYLTYPLQVNCNEITMKGNVRNCRRFPHVSNTPRQVVLLAPLSNKGAGILGQLFGHKHRTIQAITHCFQPWREHGAQSGGPELADWLSFRICTRLLELEDIGQCDDF